MQQGDQFKKNKFCCCPEQVGHSVRGDGDGDGLVELSF